MSDRPLIGTNLALLNACGLYTYKNNFWGKLRKKILIAILAITYIDVLICTTLNWNKSDSVENILIVLGFGQVVIKISTFNRKYIISTVNRMKLFYPPNKIGLKRQEKLNEKVYRKIKLCLGCFCTLFASLLGLFLCKTLFYTKPVLPYTSILGSYGSPFFEIGYVFEVLVLLFISPLQMGYDSLYISLVTNVVCEFKLLKAGFAQIPIDKHQKNDKIALEVLKNLIHHHNVIFECSKSLRRSYYIPFLCLFLLNMVGIGTCLLCIIANGIFQNLGTTVLYGTCAYFYIAQLFLYCAPGTILIVESTEVSDVIFNTDWWIKTQPQLRKAYVRILQRANKPVLLSAGGMVNVTLESFGAIVKSALSFFTCVQAMYNKH